jgi:cytochrome c553
MRAIGLALGAFGFLAAPLLAAPDAAGVQFFEQRIRPVLVKHCYKCHSAEAKKPKGGLLLDTRAGSLKGGDSGPAVVPGKVVESLIIKALRHDELYMPPDEKLPDDVIADFERWIKMGAPDPREGASATVQTKIDLEAGRKFWAFQPVQKSPLPAQAPAPGAGAWPRTDIDCFILAALAAKGVKPAPDADRAVLVRRATVALTGLPPTPEELDAAQNDTSPEWFAKVVDRLLSSPAFGERWGRHWLDVARYADSNGKDENLTFHEAFRYRDYVIASFNADKPFNQFIMEQIAGDLLPGETQAVKDEQLTATGFLVVGPKVLADRDFVKRKMDVVDEQVDTVGKVFLGLTLGCARCHDHKFDPVPTTDYYALAGIFASTRTLDGIKLGNAVVSGWMVRPLGPGGEAQFTALKDHQKKVQGVADQIKKVQAELKTHEDKGTMRVAAGLLGITVDDKEAKLVGTWKPSTYSRPYVGDGYIHDDKTGKGEKSVTFTPKLPKAGEYEVYISYTASKGRSTKTPVTVRAAEGEKTVLVNQEVPPKLDGLFHLIGKYRFEAGTAGSVTISNKDTDGYVIVDAVRWVPTGALGSDPEMAMGVPQEVKQKIADAQARLKQLQEEEKRLKAAAPPTPLMVMAVRDEAKPADLRINIRGNPHQLGDAVPRGFLAVLPAGPQVSASQSGRLELAKWLADPANPLTARVYVNRVWKHLFGEGIVRTVDNFGIQGERPTHPELLDYLARRFMDNGWSTKKLVREIMLSRTYQLASGGRQPSVVELLKADPENKLFGRANRRRLEAEVIRDAMLLVSGKLDRTAGGSAVTTLGERAIDNNSQGGLQQQMDSSTRRSVYLPVIRNDLPKIFEVFDFADPDVATGRRDATTVATQALYLMNSPFVLEQAQQTARRLLTLPSDSDRLTDLYRRALGRAPTAKETEVALRFLSQFPKSVKSQAKPADPVLEAWTALCQSVFGCTEFRFVDGGARHECLAHCK